MRFPRKLAIQCGRTTWTYSEFDEICDHLAIGLANRGIEVGERVAIISRNSHTYCALRFALARLGAILVPINFMLSADDARYILADCGARTLCVDSEFADKGRIASAGTTVTEHVWLPGEFDTAPADGMTTFAQLLEAGSLAERELSGALPAQIVYTSGTESRPKGAVLTHEAIVAEYVSCLADIGIAEDDQMLHAMPLYHCAQLDVFLGPSIYVGASNFITSSPSAGNLLALLSRHRINSFFAPPTVWISLLRSAEFDSAGLAALKKAYYGASIMPVEVLSEMLRRLPGVRLWNLYGQTEIAPLAAVLKPEDQLRKAGAAGRPTLNVETRIVDDDMQDVRPGDVGEIVHRSPQLLSCYYNDPERTAAAFRGEWFCSGDLGTMDDEGFITIVDRKKDMIKTGGENVSSREVEEALYGISGVSEVAVIGLPDPKWIEAVTAVVVLKQGSDLTEDRLIAACASRLTHFKVPKRIILTDSLPKNPSGKLLKRELRLRYSTSR